MGHSETTTVIQFQVQIQILDQHKHCERPFLIKDIRTMFKLYFSHLQRQNEGAVRKSRGSFLSRSIYHLLYVEWHLLLFLRKLFSYFTKKILQKDVHVYYGYCVRRNYKPSMFSIRKCSSNTSNGPHRETHN